MLFYQHIPKTGGISFNSWLENSVAPKVGGWCANYDFGAPMDFDMQRIFDETGQPLCFVYHKEARATAIKHIFIKSSPVPILRLVLLRDPMAHMLSAIGHDYFRNRSKDLSARIEHTFNRDCHEHPKFCEGYNLRNQQTAFLTSADIHNPEWQSHPENSLEMVLKELDEYFFVGITEHMRASQCLLMHQLNVFDASSCNVHCSQTGEQVARNSTNDANVLNTAPEATDLSFTYKQLSDLHRLVDQDIVVYAHALSLFRKRVQYVEKFHDVTLFCDSLDIVQYANYGYEEPATLIQ